MSREVTPGNGVPQLQNLNALLAYSDMPTPMQMQNGGMNGNNSYSNGSQNRKNDYVDSGVGEWNFTWLSGRLAIQDGNAGKNTWEIEKENSRFDFSGAHANQEYHEDSYF